MGSRNTDVSPGGRRPPAYPPRSGLLSPTAPLIIGSTKVNSHCKAAQFPEYLLPRSAWSRCHSSAQNWSYWRSTPTFGLETCAGRVRSPGISHNPGSPQSLRTRMKSGLLRRKRITRTVTMAGVPQWCPMGRLRSGAGHPCILRIRVKRYGRVVRCRVARGSSSNGIMRNRTQSVFIEYAARVFKADYVGVGRPKRRKSRDLEPSKGTRERIESLPRRCIWRLRPKPSRDPERVAGLALNSGESGYLLLKWVWPPC